MRPVGAPACGRDRAGGARVVGAGIERAPLARARAPPRATWSASGASGHRWRPRDDGHDLHRPDPRRRRVLPPRPRAEVGGGEHPDAVGAARPRARRDRPWPARTTVPRTTGSRGGAARPAASRRRARTGRRADLRPDARWRTPVRNGRSSSSRDLGADLPGVGVDRVAPREHEVERTFVFERGGERRRGRERVGTCERGVGDEHAVDVDAAIEAPRDRLAQACRRPRADRA